MKEFNFAVQIKNIVEKTGSNMKDIFDPDISEINFFTEEQREILGIKDFISELHLIMLFSDIAYFKHGSGITVNKVADDFIKAITGSTEALLKYGIPEETAINVT